MKEEIYVVHELEAKYQNSDDKPFIIDFFDNFDNNLFLPGSLELISKSSSIVKIGLGNFTESFEYEGDSRSLNKSCISFSVADMEFTLSDGISDDKGKKGKPFILYRNKLSTEERQKILDIISYLIGKPLIPLSSVCYDNNFYIQSILLISPYTMNGQYFKYPCQAPMPFSTNSKQEVELQFFEKAVVQIYKHYSSYCLRQVFWNLRHAQMLPVEIAVGVYSSTIELLKKCYFENNTNLKPRTKILKDEPWGDFEKKLKELLNQVSIPEIEKKLLKNKISNLNQCPQSLVAEEFLEHLGISLSENELKAWNFRNKAVHGMKFEEEKAIEYIKKTSILKIILNKIIISLTNCSDRYIDYHSLNYPIKDLKIPIT